MKDFPKLGNGGLPPILLSPLPSCTFSPPHSISHYFISFSITLSVPSILPDTSTSLCINDKMLALHISVHYCLVSFPESPFSVIPRVLSKVPVFPDSTHASKAKSCDFIYTTSWKRQIYGTGNRSVFTKSGGWGEG